MPATAANRSVATTRILDLYRAANQVPFVGKWLFSRGVCLKAPYFGSIHPVVEDLRPGYSRVRAPLRRAVKNHIGTFHAIACCNIAELAAGIAIDAGLPASHRWIPKGMTVTYLAKARTDLVGAATVEGLDGLAADESREMIVPVDITDANGTVVVHADITMWVSPRQR